MKQISPEKLFIEYLKQNNKFGMYINIHGFDELMEKNDDATFWADEVYKVAGFLKELSKPELYLALFQGEQYFVFDDAKSMEKAFNTCIHDNAEQISELACYALTFGPYDRVLKNPPEHMKGQVGGLNENT